MLKRAYLTALLLALATAVPAEHRDVQTLLDELARLDGEARRLDGELKGIFTGLGFRWGYRGEGPAPQVQGHDL